MGFITRVLLAVVGLLTLASCGFGKSKEIAAKSVTTFHQEYNNSKFGEIYSGATPAFKTATKEGDFLKFIEAVHRKLGPFQTATQSGWQVNATTSGKFVVLSFNSQFENGAAAETFTFVVSGESAALQKYNINSPVLIIN
ncbi:MAG TPA: DUF4019 domain-containing protein [Verrucomicrobiae bacterium]|nr:DUF4019 domain-containing protein [Verrucomicrobiae bacterium]